MWDSLRERLAPSYAVLVPDLPGHGRSAAEPYVSHANTITAIAELLATTVPGRPTTVIGFSLGAQLAIQLASGHPELVSQAVIVSAQAKPMPFTDLTLAALGVSAPLARKRWFAKLQARELFIPPSSDGGIHQHQRGNHERDTRRRCRRQHEVYAARRMVGVPRANSRHGGRARTTPDARLSRLHPRSPSQR
ncbi:alpha/beta fold hydrolase [Microbacterium sp. 1262]|uniref:alpha/beta fold hydrolase n=1 Tax=Microbacterium sp. 1262 TaxID=3156415 RepID=UPI003394C64B